MDNFENACLPIESNDKVTTKCWECEKILECIEFIVCCTGTRFHYCESCLKILRS